MLFVLILMAAVAVVLVVVLVLSLCRVAGRADEALYEFRVREPDGADVIEFDWPERQR